MKKMLRKPIAAFGILLLVFTFFLAACKKQELYAEPKESIQKPETKAITGGTPIQISDRPFQVLVRAGLDDAGVHTAGNTDGGGTVLSPNWIVTAAHIFDGGVPSSCQIWVGSTNVEGNFTGNVVYADSIIIHPDYNGNHKDFYDIALLRLSAPLTFTPNCSPIYYIYPNELLYQEEGSIVTASGWGKNLFSESWDQLRSTTMKVISKNSLLIPPFGFPRSDKAIYTVTDDSSPKALGSGDSGGPLTTNVPGVGDVLIGIASFSGPDGTPYPSAFTKVSDYLSWIQNITGVYRPAIAGPDAFCNSATYTVNDLPAGASVIWSASPSYFASLSTSGNSAILTNLFGGELVLTANISLGSWSTSVSKSVFSEAALNSSMTCSYAFINGLDFCNSYPVNNDASIVIDNEIYAGYYESAVISANSNISNFSITLVNKTPSSGQVYITSAGTNQYTIGLKGATTSATVQAVYQNPCGNQVSRTVYVRAPYGDPMLPEIGLEE